jgi:2-keto-3-deoxy-L-rhamnonate aldolase RhmA
MKATELRSALQRGELVKGTMVREMRTPAIMQIMAIAGFDFVLLDLEHSVLGLETVADLIRQARYSNLCTIVRVPEISKSWISRVLDAGADGIMVPYVETADEARRIMEWAKYPPVGRRGLGTQIGHTDYLGGNEAAVVEAKNRETIVITQIETPTAIRNINEIIAVPGVDYVIIGPNDLAVAMGMAGKITSEEVFAQIQQVINACSASKMPIGIHVGNHQLIERCVQAGMRIAAYSTDIGLLASAGKAAADQLRALTK